MNEQDIPIDIAVRKLVDWLISRRICSREWHENAVKIREKIGEAMQDMPENDAMKELLIGTHINYFHCQKIINILKETEAESKNFFGQYGSKRMKDWKQIVSDYEQGNIYLAESAQILTQNVVYEVPGLKKHVQKLENLQMELERKEDASKKRIVELEEEFRKNCKDLGIQGEKLKTEIISLARELPETYTSIADDSAHIKDACELYQEFVHSSMDEGVELKVLENLRFLIEHGNVTTYEWKYGEKPISVEETVLHFNEDDEEVAGEDAGGEIDFGDDDAGVIDFGDEGTEQEIDFGDGEIDFGDSGAEIDFGAEAIDFDIDGVDTSNIIVEEGGLAGGVAREEEALSILDNRRTRTILIDELEELSGFLTQRLCETESENIKFSIGSGNQNHDPQTLKSMISNVDSLISRLTEVKIQQLQMIRDSPAYADRLAESLKQKLKLKVKVLSLIEDLHGRRDSAAQEIAQVREQIQTHIKNNRILQGQLESDISGRYKGRTVNLSGV